MKNLTLFDNTETVNTVDLARLIEHVLLRGDQIQAPLENFNEEIVSEWLAATAWNDLFPSESGLYADDQITEHGCRLVAMTLPPALEPLVQNDISVLFYGQRHMLNMIYSTQPSSEDKFQSFGPFGNLSFEPPGCNEFRFPNGARGISSKYLEAVSQELFKEGALEGGTPRAHRDLMKKIKLFSGRIEGVGNFSHPLNYSYFEMIEGTWEASKNNYQPHLWMTPDLCLAIAGSEHISIQLRIIDDLNRLQVQLEMYADINLPRPSLPAYLPGTLEHNYREKGLTDLLTGEANGFFALARVKALWAAQTGNNSDLFDSYFGAGVFYPALHILCDIQSVFPLKSPSSQGGVVQLFPLSVLKEYFKDIDFSELG